MTTPPRLPTFSDGFSLFRPSMAILRRNLYTLFYLLASPFMLLIVGAYFFVTGHTGALKTFFWAVGAIVLVAAIILAVISWAGFYWTLLQSARGNKAEYGNALRAGRRYAPRILSAQLIAGLLTAIGFLLLIVPGVFMMKWFLYVPYLIIDKDVSAFTSLRQSHELSQKHSNASWAVALVQLVFYALELVPVVAIFGGIMSTLYLGAPAVRYQQLAAAPPKDKKTKTRHGAGKM